MQWAVQSAQLLAAVSHASSPNRPKNKAIVVIVDHTRPLWFYKVRSNCSQSHSVVWKQNISIVAAGVEIMQAGIKWTCPGFKRLSEIATSNACQKVCKAVGKLSGRSPHWIRANDSDYHKVRANFDGWINPTHLHCTSWLCNVTVENLTNISLCKYIWLPCWQLRSSRTLNETG